MVVSALRVDRTGQTTLPEAGLSGLTRHNLLILSYMVAKGEGVEGELIRNGNGKGGVM